MAFIISMFLQTAAEGWLEYRMIDHCLNIAVCFLFIYLIAVCLVEIAISIHSNDSRTYPGPVWAVTVKYIHCCS